MNFWSFVVFFTIVAATMPSLTPIVECEFDAETKTFTVLHPSGEPLQIWIPQDKAS